jgi:RHS repeat-associated protein
MIRVQQSTLALADTTGTIQTSYTGACPERSRRNPFGNTQSSGQGCSNSYQFAGRENDNTGLYYMRARYYAPSLQRFVSQDPMEFLGGMNLYAFVLDDPINFFDPFGLDGVPNPQPNPEPTPCMIAGPPSPPPWWTKLPVNGCAGRFVCDAGGAVACGALVCSPLDEIPPGAIMCDYTCDKIPEQECRQHTRCGN